MPLLLKPAPARLRLVLWALKEGMEVFPEAPPPGLVTMPAVPDAPAGYYPRAGYRRAGDRAVRIDMLERLADMIRPLDDRAGFEASADMLSITGLSLEQFAKLMQGLGYQATEGTRPKRRPAPPAVAAAKPEVPAPVPDLAGGEAEAAIAASGEPEFPVPTDPDIPPPEPDVVPAPEDPDVPLPPDPEIPVPEPATIPIPEDRGEAAADAEAPVVAVPEAEAPVEPEVVTDAEPAEVAAPETETSAEPEVVADAEPAETETYFMFARAPRRRPDRPPRREHRARDGGKDEAKGAPGGDKGKRRHPKGKPAASEERAPKPVPRPPRTEKPVDPDSPFAALMALKLRG
jgi:ATP-dependent RNA helicase SUPV3L1/SUV3